MRTILPVVLVLGLCGLARAADDKAAAADPVGTWRLEYAIGDLKRTATLTVKREGEKLAGTMSWADQKETELKDVKWKDGALTFSAVREVGGNRYPVEYAFSVDGDKLKGKGAVENGGRKTEFDIEGRRGQGDK